MIAVNLTGPFNLVKAALPFLRQAEAATICDHCYSERASERVALNRLGEVADVAAVALFLTSTESGFTTGTEIPVDGGFSWR